METPEFVKATVLRDNLPAGGTVAREQLKTIIERIERLEEEKKGLAEDIKEIYAEAKSNGFHVPTLRAIVRLRKLNTSERQEQEALIDLYMQALGMLT